MALVAKRVEKHKTIEYQDNEIEEKDLADWYGSDHVSAACEDEPGTRAGVSFHLVAAVLVERNLGRRDESWKDWCNSQEQEEGERKRTTPFRDPEQELEDSFGYSETTVCSRRRLNVKASRRWAHMRTKNFRKVSRVEKRELLAGDDEFM